MVDVGDCWVCEFWGISKVLVGPDDNIHLLGNYNSQPYSWPPVMFALDINGNPAGDGSEVSDQCLTSGVSWDRSGSGQTLITGLPGRGDPGSFSTTFCDPDGSPPRNYVSEALGTAGRGFFSPGGRTAFVLGGGMQVVKLDTATARPVSSFGRGGIATVNPESCRYGEAAPVADPDGLRLQRCRIEPPSFKSSFRISGTGSRRPFLNGKVAMASTPEKPGFMIQKISVRLPGGTRIKRGAAKRQVRQMSENGVGVTRVSRSRRVLTLEFDPTKENFSPDYEDETPNTPLEVLFRLKRGDLAPIPAGLRKRPMRVRVTATYEPTYGSRTLGPNGKTVSRKAVRKSGRPGRR